MTTPTSTFWFQRAGGEDAWLEAPASLRSQVLNDTKPAFTTILDAFSSPDESWGRDDFAAMRYIGPMYFDFDAEDIADTITALGEFLDKLEGFGVNLDALRLYATGGRGFHIEIPMPVFVAKAPRNGVLGMPYVFKEIAYELVVDTLDLRVYTGRKGRMWRTPGIERSNGLYKVPLTTAQARAMTPELYAELCAAPIAEPKRADPTLNPTLAAMFLKAESKVAEAGKRRAKAGGADEALLAKFKGQWPDTVKMIMAGEGLLDNVGFHKIAMQLAITANALGKTADQLVEESRDLCKNYSGDSGRYGSPRKRKEELRRMWDYTHDNFVYSYSRGGLRALLGPDTPSSDLDGVSGAAVNLGSVPSSDDLDADVDAETEAEISSAQNSLLEGLMITRTGVHKRTAEGVRTISNIAFASPTQLLDPEDNTVLGITADVLSDGVRQGRITLAGRAFTSRANLSAWCANYGGVFSGSDTQAGVVQLLLSRDAKEKGRVMYALRKEGLDVVQNPLIPDRSVFDVVFVHRDRVVCDNSAAQYVFQPLVADGALFLSDVHNAPEITRTEETEAFIHNLLDMNDPSVVAPMLGWFVSCFHKQFYQRAFSQFPLLHPNGPAGSGKTLTAMLMARLFFLKNPVAMKSCASHTTTDFSLKSFLTGSASPPVLLDEYKPSELIQKRVDLLLQSFRLAYNQGSGSSGGMSRGGATSSFREVADYTYSTPVCFMAESQETQTAIVQRCVPVSFNQVMSNEHTAQFNAVSDKAHLMASLGRLILRYSYSETVESRHRALSPVIDALTKTLDANVHPRQIYNLAVVTEGINYLERVLKPVFGEAFTARFETLRTALFEHRMEISSGVMSEAAKTMNDIALISRSEDFDSEFAIREGHEYIITDGHIDMLMRETFVKYFSWCKRKGFPPFYQSVESFSVAMNKFPPTKDRTCLTSPLRKSGKSKIFRFSLAGLGLEGVDEFKTKG